MSVRTPLYWNGSNLQEMSASMISTIVTQVKYLYAASIPVTNTVVAAGGNLGTISDTRKVAGVYRTFTNRYPTEAETAEPGTATINYARITQSVGSQTQPADTSSKAWPVFYNNGNIQAMSTTDVLDTFVRPAINELVNGSDQPGTYRIHTGTSLSGHTLISTTPVFSDTRANTGAYTAGGIPEAQDQPFTVTNYYLFRTNNISAQSYTTPLYANSSNNLQQYSTSTFDSLMQDMVRWAAINDTGYRIRYSLNGTGNNRGSGMVNTILNGSGNYQIRYVNADDYRAQEFPDGSAVTANTYYLRIYKV